MISKFDVAKLEFQVPEGRALVMVLDMRLPCRVAVSRFTGCAYQSGTKNEVSFLPSDCR